MWRQQCCALRAPEFAKIVCFERVEMTPGGDGCGAGARPRSCADFLSDWVCVRTVCAYLVPRRVVAVERTCRAVQAGVEVGSVWSAQGPVQAQLLSIVHFDLVKRPRLMGLAALNRTGYFANRLFAEVLKGMLRDHGVGDVLRLLSDIVHQGPSLSGLSPGHRWVRGVGGAGSSARRIWALLGDDGGVSGGHGGSSAGVDVCDGRGPGAEPVVTTVYEMAQVARMSHCGRPLPRTRLTMPTAAPSS